MASLPAACLLALAAFGDGAVLRIFARSLGLTVTLFALLGAGLLWGINAFRDGAGIAAGGGLVGGLADGLGAALALLLTLLIGWLAFRIVALAVLQFFADDVVLAIEARHYPAAAASARPLSLGKDAALALRGTGTALLANLLALPFVLWLTVTGIGAALLLWAVNAFLLGRELHDMVWARHRADARARRPVGPAPRFALGGITAALLFVPFANLLAPIWGAAATTHLYHRRNGAAHAV